MFNRYIFILQSESFILGLDKDFTQTLSYIYLTGFGSRTQLALCDDVIIADLNYIDEGHLQATIMVDEDANVGACQASLRTCSQMTSTFYDKLYVSAQRMSVYLVLEGNTTYSGFGKAVAAAGNIDGDTFGDFLVGSPDMSTGGGLVGSS